MILIVGQSHDDVLYYENILRNKKSINSLFRTFPCVTGHIFNQEVTIIYNVVTSYVSGIVISTAIQQFKPNCVIYVGKCKAITKSINVGDIILANNIVPIDIDQCEYFDVKVGEIPVIQNDFHVDQIVLELLRKTCETTLTKDFHTCTLLCANKIYANENELEMYGHDDSFFGRRSRYVLDSDCISALLACKFHDIPFVTIKVVDSRLGEVTGVENFVKTLGAYAKVGKTVASFIGELGRRDLL